MATRRLDQDHVVLDPSRVAVQIVSGIGFIGGGLIFVRRDSVRGLTTAAGVWVTAAVGTAAGAGQPAVAAPHLPRRPRHPARRARPLHRRRLRRGRPLGRPSRRRDDAVAVQLELRGPGSLTGLATELGGLDGVLAVSGEDLAGAPD